MKLNRYLYIVLLLGLTSFQNDITTEFVRLKDLDDSFKYEMRYATTNNFLKEKVYDCADCFIRKEVATALIKANNELKSKGYKIKFFDCYRPLDVQKKNVENIP